MSELDFDSAYKLLRQKDVYTTLVQYRNKDDSRWCYHSNQFEKNKLYVGSRLIGEVCKST